MTFEELKESLVQELIGDMKVSATLMIGAHYEIMTTQEIIAFCIKMETTLFRARIKLEREINHK